MSKSYLVVFYLNPLAPFSILSFFEGRLPQGGILNRAVGTTSEQGFSLENPITETEGVRGDISYHQVCEPF